MKDSIDRGEYPRPLQWAVEQLRRGITAGEFAPNSYLPGERALAEALGIGRTTLREALVRLEELRLVERSPNRGTRVLTGAERLGSKPIGVVYRWLKLQHWAESANILEGVQDRILQLGYPWRRITYDDRPDAMQQARNGVVRRDDILTLIDDCAGVIFIEGGDETMLEYAQELEERRFPVAVANLERGRPLAATWVDHAKATRQAVQTLVSFGHRRIGFVGRTRDAFFYGEAEDAYRTAMGDAGIDVDERLIAVADATNSLSAFLAARPLLDQPVTPTAIVAARDALAHGVCRAIEESGGRVGYDVSVIGFDDLSWPSAAPTLTTFREPCHEMGAIAAQMLIDRLIDGWKPLEKREVEAPFILRRSAGPAPLAPSP
jgi:DNA-binding LacI/PurR family transcriptional regulator